MSTSRRAVARRDVGTRRRLFLRSAGQRRGEPRRVAPRRVGHMEFLESRTLLASDAGIFVSNFWNYRNPTDVNADGRVTPVDLLPIINSITTDGVRSLPGRYVGSPSVQTAPLAGAEGETASTQPTYYIDSNNDGKLNVLDLLAVVNSITRGEGEDPEPLVRLRLEPVIAGTITPLSQDGSGRYLIPEGDYYELRLMAQDTGVLTFNGVTRPAALVGLLSVFADVSYDPSRTDIQVTETQVVTLTGSPTSATRFTLTFNGQTTAPIAVSDFPTQTAINIRNALVALPGVGRTALSNLRNVEVEPATPASTTSFRVRFIYDLGNQDFATMSGAITTAGGATGVSVTTTVDGNPNDPDDFEEMFYSRAARNQESAALPILNGPLYFQTSLPAPGFYGGSRVPQGFNDAGGWNDGFLASTNPDLQTGTQLVEVYRVRMHAADGDASTPVSFVGSVEDLATQFIILNGGFDVIPANLVAWDPAPQLLITEPISAVNDEATINEGAGATVLIPVLANDVDNTGPSNLVLVTPLTPIAPAQGTITVQGNQIRYTVPNGDFNGEVTFQYTIRDGVNAAITDTGTVKVTVKATNDAPVNNVPGAQSVNEDLAGGLVFSAANSNAITISDVDAGAGILRVQLNATDGVITLGSQANLVVTGNGTNQIVATGTLTDLNAGLSGLRYTPAANFNGPATLTIATSDQGNTAHPDNASVQTDTDVVNINVVAVNDPPVNTVPAAREVDEGSPLAFLNGDALSVADIDAGAGTIRVDLSTNSTGGGTLAATAAGGATVTGSGSQSVRIEGTLAAVNATLLSLVFQAGAPETVTLTMLTSDLGNTGLPGPLTDSDQVQITVLATVRPRATPNTFNVAEGAASFEFNVLANDLANAGASVTLETVGAPTVGSTAIDDKGTASKTDDTVIYTPPADFFGTVTFSYTISEDPVTAATVLGPNATAIVTVNIANTPDVPVAQNDGPYSATEDVVLTVTAASGVLANDTDADNLVAPFNAGLTAVLTQQPPAGQGTVALAADGSFTWTPTAGANFFGTTSFTYQARDPQNNLSAAATVTINVAPVNDAPVAVDDGPGGLYQTPEDTPLSIAAPGVLANDTDVDTPAGQLTVVITQQPLPAQGTVTLNPDGSFLFTPALNFNGQASFRYRVLDNDPVSPQQSNEATVRITVVPVNDAPVAGDAEFMVEEGQVLQVSVAQGLRTFVTDPDQPAGFTGAISLVTGPAQGTLNLQSDGSFTYTPPSTVINDFDVTFTYTAFDGQATSNEGTVTIHVTEFNDPPVAGQDGPFPVQEDVPFTLAAPGLLANDTDEETPTANLTAVLVTNVPAAAGSVALNADGSFTYTPAPHFFGTTSFSYQARDAGLKVSNTITVTLNVAEINDAPIANDDVANDLVKDVFNQKITPNPLANDSKGPDAATSEVLRISSVDPLSAGNGTLSLVAGEIFYTPEAGFVGIDSFEYTITDDRGGFDTATVSFEVLDFVPKSIGGTVYIDADNDGVIDAGEKRLAGVRVDLTGQTVIGAFAAFTTTDANGNYSFSGLAPGSYTLTQSQPLYFTSGKDSVNTSPITADSVTNASQLDNVMQIAWSPLDFDGNITGLNFGERGIDATSLADASGLLQEILASSSLNGMIFSVDATGQMDWSYCLSGWNTTATCQLQMGASGSISSILVTIGGVTKRIYQDPSNNHGGETPPTGSLARFRVLGRSGTGDFIIRLDGQLSDFGFLASAALPAEGELPEGEGPAMSDGEYRHAADEVFTQEAWA